jgi:3-mercaptopyruvate sulfurtransferase SseA
MRLKYIFSGMVLAAVVILTSCNAQDSAVNTNANQPTIAPETTYADGVRRITTGELETLINEGKAYIVDVRLEDAYNMGHIPGSHLIPAGDILQHVDKLPRDKMIVTYCS